MPACLEFLITSVVLAGVEIYAYSIALSEAQPSCALIVPFAGVLANRELTCSEIQMGLRIFSEIRQRVVLHSLLKMWNHPPWATGALSLE